MKISHLATLGFITTLGFATSATAQVDGGLYVINESSSPMCALYITTPDGEFNDSPELLAANGVDCIESGGATQIWYEGLSDCYAVVEIFDDIGEPLYTNGFELCTREHIVITDDDVSAEGSNDEPVPDIVVEEGNGHIGYLEIVNTSEQQLCQVYFQSLQGTDEFEVYQAGEGGNCLDPDMVQFLEYSLATEECEVRLSIETGFLDVLYDQVYDLCQRTEVLVSD